MLHASVGDDGDGDGDDDTDAMDVDEYVVLASQDLLRYFLYAFCG